MQVWAYSAEEIRTRHGGTRTRVICSNGASCRCGGTDDLANHHPRFCVLSFFFFYVLIVRRKEILYNCELHGLFVDRKSSL